MHRERCRHEHVIPGAREENQRVGGNGPREPFDRRKRTAFLGKPPEPVRHSDSRATPR